jgi:hypothetical protein
MLAPDDAPDSGTIGDDARNRGVVAAPARQRKIIHIDMDAFYASVEQRDNPELRGRPVAVGGSRERGVVAAASYEARKFGVRSAMPSVTAKRKCPELIFVKPRFDAYKEASRQIRAIFARHTPIIEPLSLDEAYLDVTENLKGSSTATEVAEAIRAKIRVGSRRRRGSPRKSGRLSATRPTSPPPPASPITNSWRSSPPITANPTDYSSSRRAWGRPSSRHCRSGNSTASVRRRRGR